MKEAQTTQEALNAALKEAQAWTAAALAAQTERDALTAQDAALISAIDGIRSTPKPSGFGSPTAMQVREERLAWMRLNEVTSMTPQQHLAEIRAEAIVDAIKRCNIYMAFQVKHGKLADEVIAVPEINQYAEEIRKGGAK